MSAYPQKRTLSRLFDHLVGALQDCFGKVMPNALRLKTIKRRIAESGSVVCIYIPGNGMISTISIHAPSICRWGWSLSNIFVAASSIPPAQPNSRRSHFLYLSFGSSQHAWSFLTEPPRRQWAFIHFIHASIPFFCCSGVEFFIIFSKSAPEAIYNTMNFFIATFPC